MATEWEIKLSRVCVSIIQTDSEVHLMAVKTIENITTTVTNPSHPLLNLGICSTLWYLFTHSNGDAVKVAAVSVSWKTSKHSCKQLHNVYTVYDLCY